MSALQKIIRHIKDTRFFMLAQDMPYQAEIKRNTSLFQQYGIKKPLWKGITYNDITAHDTENLPWLDKNISEADIKAHPAFSTFSPQVQQQILQWKARGYMIVKDFFSPEQVDTLINSVEGCLNEKEKAAYHSSRFHDLWTRNTQVDFFFRDPELIKLLSFMLGREAVPFQTINFYKGTQQHAHSDSIHFTTEPFGYLIAVWVALEDIKEGSGELLYYPGSHTMPFLSNKDYDHGNTWLRINPLHYQHYEKKMGEVVQKTGMQTETFLARKGDILIWHANLIHGGSKITNKTATRKSLVMHYYGKDVLCYCERAEKLAILSRLKKRLSC